ncbi:MAG: pyridoxamine 5'-phosphate oxidase family protein [Prevotella sp.]|nr:pyridoxamine 5'-phosphate oxidase family protein [Prevotella sp.]
MRKASRQMDATFALEVLDKAPYVTVSFTRPDGSPYGVPLSLARKATGRRAEPGNAGENTFYFHCALEGDKLDCIAVNPTVSLSAVTRCTPTVGPKDGSFTLQYKSAMAVGKAEVVTDRNEKIEALRTICLRFLPKHMDAFDEAIQRSIERTAVVKITLTAPPTGKRKQYDKQGEELKWGRTE